MLQYVHAIRMPSRRLRADVSTPPRAINALSPSTIPFHPRSVPSCTEVRVLVSQVRDNPASEDACSVRRDAGICFDDRRLTCAGTFAEPAAASRVTLVVLRRP